MPFPLSQASVALVLVSVIVAVVVPIVAPPDVLTHSQVYVFLQLENVASVPTRMNAKRNFFMCFKKIKRYIINYFAGKHLFLETPNKSYFLQKSLISSFHADKVHLKTRFVVENYILSQNELLFL